jgi:hypothetical protein
MNGMTLETVYDRSRIEAMLRYSQQHGTTIGIHSPVMGGGVYITSIENVIPGEEIMVVLRSYDPSGIILKTSKLKLTDIRCVFPFQPVFENPYIKDLHRYTAA